MLEPIVIGLLVLLVLVPIALGCLWGFMVLVNKQQGLNFHDAFTQIQKDPLACAVYFGARFFAVAYLIGQLFSRFV